MRKFAITAIASIFIFGSPVTIASGYDTGITPISAENMSSFIRCKGKKPGESVKSRTRVENGKIPLVKCGDVNKIVSDARAENAKAKAGK